MRNHQSNVQIFSELRHDQVYRNALQMTSYQPRYLEYHASSIHFRIEETILSLVSRKVLKAIK